MPLDHSFVGREFPSRAPYQVGREKVREYASAVGDDSPVCHDPAAARAAGYSDVVAPPTFAFTLTMRAMNDAVADPALGLQYGRVVHGEQRFHFERPIVAGDELTVTTTIADITVKRSNEYLTTRSEIHDSYGELVAVTHEVIVSRGTGGGAQ